jgi:glycosyltransferase involved in cell wall biosynthesis
LRIVFTHCPPDLYGASRSLLRLVTRLVGDGHNVLVLLPYSGPLCDELMKVGAEVELNCHLAVLTRRVAGNKLQILKLFALLPLHAWKLSRRIKRFGADLVHTNTALILAPGIASRIARREHIWHVREVFTDSKAVWLIYQRYMERFSARIIAVSEAVKNQFVPQVQKKITVVNNGFPIDEFQCVSEARVKAFRERYGTNGNATIGLIGRIKFGRKGQDVFLQAAAQVAKRFPSAQFFCVGSTFPGNEDHLDRFFALRSALGLESTVTYTGDVEDIKAAYAAMDIVVQPSTLPEAFGGVVIEAMAFGKAVVASASGGTVEQVVDGTTGFLVPPGNVEALASRIAELLEDPGKRQLMGTRGRQRFLQNFEFEPYYRSISGLYQAFLSR